MITREEAKKCMDFDSNAERMSTKRNNALIDKIYDSFEQHIKSLEAQLTNTEQLTCEGCRHKYTLMVDNNAPCGQCAVNPYIINHYNKKDTK